MRKTALVLLLITASLQAQTWPARSQGSSKTTQEWRILKREASPQGDAVKNLEGLKLNELGYFTLQEPGAATAVQRVVPAPSLVNKTPVQTRFIVRPRPACAIPLTEIPVDPQQFAAKTVEPGPPTDPRIVVAPPLPACSENETVSTIQAKLPLKR